MIKGECLSLAKQVEYFTLTATKDLPKAIENPKKLCEHLAESIYLLLIENNDYFPMLNGNITDKFSPEDFADYLIDELTKHIKVRSNDYTFQYILDGYVLHCYSIYATY